MNTFEKLLSYGTPFLRSAADYATRGQTAADYKEILKERKLQILAELKLIEEFEAIHQKSMLRELRRRADKRLGNMR